MKAFALAAALLVLGFPAAAQRITIPVPPTDFTLPGTFKAGRFYGPRVTVQPANTAVSAANRLTAIPMYIPQGSVLKSLSFNIGTGNAAAWNARMCVYQDTGAGLPGALLIDSGTVAIGSGSVTGNQTASINSGNGIAVGGWVWMGFMADSASESVLSLGNAAGGPIYSSSIQGWSSLAFASAGTPTIGVYMAQTFGACPATFSATPSFADNTAIPYVFSGY